MQAKFEHYLFAKQLDNLTQLLSRSGLRNKLVEWTCEDGFEKLGVFIPEYDEDAPKQSKKNSPLAKLASRHWRYENQPISPAAWKEFAERISLTANRLKPRSKSPLQKNIESLAKEIGCDSIETGIIGIAVRLKNDHVYENLCDTLFETKKITINQLIAALLGIKPLEVSTRLNPSSLLVRTGLIKLQSSSHRPDFSDFLELPEIVVRAVLPPNLGIKDIKSAIFGTPGKADLVWSDFEHIQNDRDFISALLKGAVRNKAKGINILLYGPPGTGKTELCKTLAEHLKLDLHSVGESDECGNQPTRDERISSLRLSNHLLARHKGSVLLFDEMEDILDNRISSFFSGSSGISKVFINRVLENNAVPTFWTCNEISEFDPALLRRMTFAVEMRSPPKNVRERIWKKVLRDNKLSISEQDVTDLAQVFEGPPALAANAARAARLADGGAKQIKLSLAKMAKVSGTSAITHPLACKETAFNPALLNTDQDLSSLTDRIVGQSVAKNFSFCLYGPAGTGKSAFVHHLAEKMGIELIQKRASELFSKWVGSTEKNIAAAFQEAQDKEAFLIFDEADSLLRDRKDAIHSWEVTQVNEMLTWMESHPLPFACTTNLMGNLDPASLRRFTFKINCDFLTLKQTKATFQHFFNLSAPAAIENLDVLTPGDFAVVLKRAAITGQLSDTYALLSMLREECKIKPESPSPIGFNASMVA